jgi:hypothetical protein
LVFDVHFFAVALGFEVAAFTADDAFVVEELEVIADHYFVTDVIKFLIVI